MADLPSSKSKRRTSVELFAGGGGLAMAVHQARFRPLLFNEFNDRACQTLVRSAATTLGAGRIEYVDDPRPSRPREGEPVPLFGRDVRKLDLSGMRGDEGNEEVDLLAGGPPCQPFSVGGVAKGDEDKRNMFPAIFEAVREMHPKAVLCENVRGLLRPSFARYFQYIQNELSLPFVQRAENVTWQVHNEELERMLAARSDDDRDVNRYRVVMVKVNAADYGVPQVRHRVVLVAFRADLGVDVEAFEKEVKTRQFSDKALYRTQRRGGEYWKRHDDVPSHVRERVIASLPEQSDADSDEMECEPWFTLRDALRGYGLGGPLPPLPEIDLTKLDRRTEQAASLGITDHVGWPGARIYPGHTPNELDKPAKTVKAGVHGVPGGESVLLLDERFPDSDVYQYRYMTVRETARAMSFPDEWQGAGPRGEKMRQLGNAVPVVLGKHFAEAIANALDSVGH
jgi:DNA (cytosine-5)-methyltransferase 1